MNERTRTFLAVEARLSLKNLALCRQVCALLRDYIARKLPPPQVCVQFSGKGDQPILIGDNCGFFTTPIVLTALVDIRKFTLGAEQSDDITVLIIEYCGPMA